MKLQKTSISSSIEERVTSFIIKVIRCLEESIKNKNGDAGISEVLPGIAISF